MLAPASSTTSTSLGNVHYLSLDGPLSLMKDGWVDFTLEWELLLKNSQGSGNSKYFLQKGPFALSYDNGSKLCVTIGSIEYTFTNGSTITGMHAFESVLHHLFWHPVI